MEATEETHESYRLQLLDNEKRRVVDVTIHAPSAGAARGVLDRSYAYPRFVRLSGFTVEGTRA